MNLNDVINRMIDVRLKNIRPIVCTVDSVTGDNVVASPLNGDAKIRKVRLYPDMIVKPKEGSLIRVLMVTDVIGVCVHVEEAESIKLGDGSYGGLAKMPELEIELNKLKDTVDALVNSLLSFVPVPLDGGAALKAFATGQLAGKTTGDFSNLENEKITHGDI